MKDIDLNTSPALPESDASLDGGTNGSVEGTSNAALKRGYAKIPGPEQSMSDITLCDDGPMDNGGFLGRAQGWER